MKKYILSLLILLGLGFTAQNFAQGVSCPAVVAGPDTVLGCGDCVLLEAVPVSGFEPTDYTVQQIPYVPYSYTTGTSILLNIDDTWSSVLPLGFDFCFYGNTYNSCVIGSNGLITFDLTQAGGYCQYPINNPIPSNQNPMNSIMAPWHDSDPSIAGQIRWAQYGTAPCRVFVISFDQIAMFSCNNLISTQQIVLYETTNVIETYIENKPTCSTWNGGAAIHGIQNANGTQAVVVPGRNYPTQWTATNDAWAFVPSGAPNYDVAWYIAGNSVPFDTLDTVTVCPVNPTDYVAVVTYVNCNGDSVVVSDTASVSAFANPTFTLSETHTDVSCFGGSDGTATVTATGTVGTVIYQWTPIGGNAATATNLPAGTYTCTVTDAGGCPVSIDITIEEPTQVWAQASATDASCFGGSDGTVTVVDSGGVGGYTYAWNPNVSTSNSATGLPAGSYTITVTDTNGCSDTATATVGQPIAITSQTTQTPTSCFNGNDGTATVNASGGTGSFTYQWVPGGQTTATATGLDPGLYVAIVTDSLGCTDTAQVVVTQPQPISTTISATDATCNTGSDGTATVVATGGTGTFNYAWSPSGGNMATATGLTAGVYTVVVTDANGCRDSNSVVVDEPAPNGMNLFHDNESCWNACDGTVSVQPLGGTGPFTYQWNTPNNDVTQTVQGLCNGWYTVTITDANGCTAIDSEHVDFPPAPVASAGPDVSFCEGEGGAQLTSSILVPGGGAPYYYIWTCSQGPCGLSCVNCPNPIANPTDTTTYYLVVKDQNGCGSLVDSVQVNVIPKPVVDAGPDQVICGDDAFGVVLTPTVTGFGPYSYNWTPGAGLNDSTILTPYARPDTTTIYTLVVTDLATGCTSEFTTTDTLATVTVSVNPVPIADAGPDRDVCDGESIVLQGLGYGAGPSYMYQWSPSSSLNDPTLPNPTASPAFTTEYILTVISNDCPSYGDTVRVTVHPQPTVDAGPDRDYCYGGSAQLDGVVDSLTYDTAMQFFWSPGLTLSDSTIEDPIAFPDQTTEYFFWVESSQGCLSPMDSMTVTIRETPLVEAGEPITWCLADSTLQLDGEVTWANGLLPSDLSDYSVDWGPDAYIVGPDNVEDPIVSPPTSMWFYFTATYDSCTTTDSVLVQVIDEINAEAMADTTVMCGEDSVLLMATGGIGGANFTWTPANGLAHPDSSMTLASPEGTTTYQVLVEEAGCFDSAEVTIEVIPRPEVAFVNSFAEGCVAHSVSFTSLSTNSQFLTWDFGDGSPNENGESPLHVFEEPGTYEVTLFGVNFGGCTDSSESVTITVFDTISADFSSVPSFPVELVIPGSEVEFTDETVNGSVWNWDFGNGEVSSEQNPVTTFSEPGSYMVSLLVQNAFGCVSQVMHGPYVVSLPDLFIPNVFSPNDDDVNDLFRVDYSGNQPYTLTVFDRWGVQVFQTRNKTDHWDGMLEGTPAMDGTYYYVLRVGDKEYAGNITLVR